MSLDSRSLIALELIMTVDELRQLWKPHKERLAASRSDHPTNVRIHRACSWLHRVEQIEDGQDLEFTLTGRWIAFNAMYGLWNEQAKEPRADRDCWRRFLDRVLAFDAEGHLKGILADHKKLVMSILDDNYLGSYFWRDPSAQRALHTTKDKREASMWYVERRWSQVLEALVDRIYLLRCQLLHGAATFGSKLNRSSLRRCSMMLGHLVPAILQAVITHGTNEDWGPMCYPPIVT